MTPNEQAAARIRAYLRTELPAVGRRTTQSETSRAAGAFAWKDWGGLAGLGQNGEEPGFFGQLWGTVRDTGFAIADAYAQGEIAEQQARAAREQIAAEIARARAETERLRAQAIAQQDAELAARLREQEREAMAAEREVSNGLGIPSAAFNAAALGVAVLGALGIVWLARQ